MWAYKTKNGFTIVELLIVIVVISILAAITITAFNGIQQRARNSARIAAAVAITKAIDAYTIQTGANLPVPVCVPTGGKDYSGDSIPDCSTLSTTSGRWTEKAAFNTALTAAGFNNFSFPSDEVVGANGTKYGGVAITYGASDRGMGGTLQPNFVYFWLEGANQDCTSGYSVKVDTANPDPLYWIVPGKSYGSSNGTTTCAYTVKHVSSI
jgi:prepilin-type N-terminal cleavage/methylation domain-containing protein